jgi:hypothetical protein
LQRLLADRGSFFFASRDGRGPYRIATIAIKAIVDEGKLRVLGAFRKLAKSVGSRNGNKGFGSLFSIKFELDFHCR